MSSLSGADIGEAEIEKSGVLADGDGGSRTLRTGSIHSRLISEGTSPQGVFGQELTVQQR
jgi:hypothetical protein